MSFDKGHAKTKKPPFIQREVARHSRDGGIVRLYNRPAPNRGAVGDAPYNGRNGAIKAQENFRRTRRLLIFRATRARRPSGRVSRYARREKSKTTQLCGNLTSLPTDVLPKRRAPLQSSQWSVLRSARRWCCGWPCRCTRRWHRRCRPQSADCGLCIRRWSLRPG